MTVLSLLRKSLLHFYNRNNMAIYFLVKIENAHLCVNNVEKWVLSNVGVSNLQFHRDWEAVHVTVVIDFFDDNVGVANKVYHAVGANASSHDNDSVQEKEAGVALVIEFDDLSEILVFDYIRIGNTHERQSIFSK